MKNKICFVVLLSGMVSYANGQIGAATISSKLLATIAIGSSDNYGKSNLPVCLPRSVSCSQAFTYTFIGSGNWTLPTNWEGDVIPPANLPTGAIIIINPVSGGECILNTTQTVLNGASIIVKAGKKLKLLNQLIIQH